MKKTRIRSGQDQCRCKRKPVTVAVFRNTALVRIERRHWRLPDRCELPTEEVDIKVWRQQKSPVRG